MRQITWVGWIKAHPGAKDALRNIGVEGEMKYNEEHRCFEYCEASGDVMRELINLWPEFNPRCFTGIDHEGSPLLRDQQPYWRYIGRPLDDDYDSISWP